MTHVNNVVLGKQDVTAHLHLINSQLPWASASSKRSKLGASTHLHQATGFVTTANLCLGHADILHNITVTRRQSPIEFFLAVTFEIIKRERDLRVCVSNLIGRWQHQRFCLPLKASSTP